MTADSLLDKLTLDQKISLLAGDGFWRIASFPELSIPSILLSDGPNGVRGEQHFDMQPAACFPCGTGMGATFDKDLLYKAGSLMALEAKAKRAHAILGPTVNIQRSPLGGRGFESFSEDPTLSGMSAAAVINGIQDGGIQATIKHYVCNDGEDDRMGVDAVVSQRALREIYLLPFQLAVRLAKPGAFMTSYNKVNGVHVSESKLLLDDILRHEWQWDGLIMSDWGGVYSTVASLKAGLDLEMPGPGIWRSHLITNAIVSKELHPDVVDAAAGRVLKFIEKCNTESGLGPTPKQFSNDTPETRALLREMAQDSVVLLKNEAAVLPLKKDKTVAVIGPNGFYPVYCGGGSAALHPYYAVSLLDGVAAKTTQKPTFSIGAEAYNLAPPFGAKLRTADGEQGWTLTTFDLPKSDKKRKQLDKPLRRPETIILFADYEIPEYDEASNFYCDIEGFFTPELDGDYNFEVIVIGTAKLYIDDKLVADNSVNQKLGEAFYGMGSVPVVGTVTLTANTKYKVSIEYGSAKTSSLFSTTNLAANFLRGSLRVGCKRSQSFEESREEAVQLARNADQVILAVGLNDDWETESHDRKSMDLPPHVDELAEAVLGVRPDAVVVVQSGTPVSLPWASQAKTIVQAWYAGNEVGNGIADVLFGDVNPSGKLPLSYPIRNEDNPAFLTFRSEQGKTHYCEHVYVGYRYYETRKMDVLFPFGHGLSYTTFEYSNLVVLVENGHLNVSVDITNTGKVDGKESVQFYISQDHCAVNRPVKELRDYAKAAVEAGATQTISVAIPIKYATSYWDEFGEYWRSDKGSYKVHVAASSADVRLTGAFQVNDTTKWKGA